MKNVANLLTGSRIVAAAAFFLSPPFSALFWLCYLWAGISDVVDGFVARRLGLESDFGARFDSLADLVFVSLIIAIIIIHIGMPSWLWLGVVFVALLRFIGYAIGYRKYRTFSGLHTYANKAAGLLLFAFPLMYAIMGIETAGLLLCIVSLFSAAEEVLITVSSDRLDRNRISLLIS